MWQEWKHFHSQDRELFFKSLVSQRICGWSRRRRRKRKKQSCCQLELETRPGESWQAWMGAQVCKWGIAFVYWSQGPNQGGKFFHIRKAEIKSSGFMWPLHKVTSDPASFSLLCSTASFFKVPPGPKWPGNMKEKRWDESSFQGAFQEALPNTSASFPMASTQSLG